MTQVSRFWDGTTVGDATGAPYDAAMEFARVMQSVSGAGGVATNLSAVFRGELNELAVTGAVTPVSINTGRAITAGTWYENDAATTVAIPTPSVSTRIDRIVLRKDWSAAVQTVRVTRIAGAEGGGAPALVQVWGTTWDQPLAQVSITIGGAITLTDQRQFVGSGPLVNISTFAVGDLLYAGTTTTLAKLTIGAANTVLTSSGVAPQWSTSLNLAGSLIATTLGVGVTPAYMTHLVGTDGALIVADNNTNATSKTARIGVRHYTNADEPFYALVLSATVSTNTLSIGGGSGLGNAATAIAFYTAANNTTTDGTLRWSISSTGHLVASVTNTYDLGISGFAARDVWCVRGAFNGSHIDLKRNYSELAPSAALDAILGTAIYRFQYKEMGDDGDPNANRWHVGVLLGNRSTDQLFSDDDENVNPQTTAAIAVAGVQALHAKLEEQAALIATLLEARS